MIQGGVIYLPKELKNIKREINVWFYLMLGCILFGLVSCANQRTPKPTPIPSNNTFPVEYRGFLNDKKVYLTSFGQSVEIEDLALFYREFPNAEFTMNYRLMASDVEEDSVILAVIGCSIKGLQEQEISVNSEIARAQEFVTKAKNDQITLITWHIGGAARRGSTSDNIIAATLAGADLCVFVTTGNTDNFLSEILNENEVPFYHIPTIANLKIPLQYLMGESMEE